MIEELGKEGEEKIMLLLKSWRYKVQSPDWLAEKDGEWICVEAKRKERFTPPPFEGHGLDLRQVFLRNKMLKEIKIRTLLVIYEIGTDDIYFQWLDILEKGEKFVTKNNIVIYPLKIFQIMGI